MNDPGSSDIFRHARRTPYWGMVRLGGMLLAYTTTLAVCRWLAYQFRFDFNVPPDVQEQLTEHWLWVTTLQVGFLVLFRQFSGMTRYFGLPDLERLAGAMLCGGALLYAIRFSALGFFSPPRGVILVQVLLGFLSLAGIRLAYRLLCERGWSIFWPPSRKQQHAVIIGAGDVGSMLVSELTQRPGLGLCPVCFLDDDRHTWNRRLHDVPVLGPPESLKKWVARYNLAKVILAMPSATPKRLAEVAELARQCGLSCVTVPAIGQLTSGHVSVSHLRAVSIEDLLGRDPVTLETEAIRHCLEGRVVMVTGAGGSIGSELCRQIATCAPSRLLLVDQCEVQLFAIEQEMIRNGHGQTIVPLVANVLDPARMKALFATHRPTVVFHAAAHKHVPMMERQPTEAVRNNSLASARLGELAQAHGVERFLMISTDKAVNPTSAMGASKRLAEIYLQSLFAHNRGGTKFICVRFGNVLGSSGSVVPTFTRQIAEGGPVTVTDPEMMRYFMTIPEAVGLVLQSCAQGEGGEIFVLDMGKPIKIATLARQMIELSGMKPDVDIEIKFVGLRPGEKLFEELRCDDENFRPTRHPRIMSFVTPSESLARLRLAFDRLEAELYELDTETLKQRIRQLVPEYEPYAEQPSPPQPPPPAPSSAPSSAPSPAPPRRSQLEETAATAQPQPAAP